MADLSKVSTEDLMKMLGGAPADKATPPEADAANAAPVGENEGALYAALHGVADTATFGMADRLGALGRSAVSTATGKPLSYAEAYAKIKANNAATDTAHPVAAIVGDVGGLLAGGEALAATGALRGVVKAGQPIMNVVRSAGVGAGFGAADAAGHGGSADQVALAAAGGAVLGPVAGKVTSVAAKALTPAAQRAMSLLADKIGESSNTLERAFTNFRAQTGQTPTLAQIVGLKTSGELRQLAGQNAAVGTAVTEAADKAAADLPTSLPQHIEKVSGAPPQDINTLTTARKTRMDTAMTPIRTKTVTIDGGDLATFADPRLRAATNGDPALRNKVNAVKDALSADPNAIVNDLTVDDIDSIRKALRGRQASYANPQSTSHNPHTAVSYGKLADSVGSIASSQVPDYGTALEQFGADSDYINGFQHGMSGKTIGEAAKPSTIDSLNEPAGRDGYASGVQSRLTASARSSEAGAASTAKELSQTAGTSDQVAEALGAKTAVRLKAAGSKLATGTERLNTIAPGVPNPPADFSGRQLAQGAAAAVGHSPAGIMFHLSRALPNLSRLSPAVQKTIAKYLTDPKMTRQGIALLRRAGASNDDLRRLTASISGITGAHVGEAASGGQ